MRNRFYLPQQLTIGETVELNGEEFHHAVRVHRSRAGEEIELFDGKGSGVVARIESIEKDHAKATITEKTPARDAKLQIHLALALIQPEKFEQVLQKGTELGVASFLPLISQRTEIKSERVSAKMDRWSKIVLEATKQCGRSALPIIEPPMQFGDAIRRPGSRLLFEADQLNDRAVPEMEPITILIGPEGGWSEAEIRAGRLAGCTFRTLGPRRLRAETAAIAAVTLVSILRGDMR